jgi:hypothetical protein
VQERVVGVGERLVLVDVHSREAGASSAERVDERPRLDQRRPARVHEHGGRLHAREVGGRDDPPRGLDEPQVQGEDVALLEERVFALCHGIAVAACTSQ